MCIYRETFPRSLFSGIFSISDNSLNYNTIQGINKCFKWKRATRTMMTTIIFHNNTNNIKK